MFQACRSILDTSYGRAVRAWKEARPPLRACRKRIQAISGWGSWFDMIRNDFFLDFSLKLNKLRHNTSKPIKRVFPTFIMLQPLRAIVILSAARVTSQPRRQIGCTARAGIKIGKEGKGNFSSTEGSSTACAVQHLTFAASATHPQLTTAHLL